MYEYRKRFEINLTVNFVLLYFFRTISEALSWSIATFMKNVGITNKVRYLIDVHKLWSLLAVN